MALTKRQKDVMDFIADFMERNGYSPSYDEIGQGLKLASLATVHKHICTLSAKRYLERGVNQSRSIELGSRFLQEHRKQRETRRITEIPFAGRIAAGPAVEAIEQRDTLNLTDFVRGPDTFALEVRGDSMIGDHIMSGDIVLLEKTAHIRDGDVVVALVEGSDATLKRYYREPDGVVRLQPSNPALVPIRVPAEQVQVQGRLVAVLRKY